MRRISLTQYPVEPQREHGRISAHLRLLFEIVARTCKHLVIQVTRGASGASIHVVPNRFPQGEFLLLFDPLDGSSNSNVKVFISTIFSVLRKVGHTRGVSEVRVTRCLAA